MLAVQNAASQPSLAELFAWIDQALLVLGAIIVAVWAVRLLRSPRRRQALDLPADDPESPGLPHVLLVVAAYILLFFVIRSQVLPGTPTTEVPPVGSARWHWSMNADSAAKLIATVLAAAFLAARPALRTGNRSENAPRSIPADGGLDELATRRPTNRIGTLVGVAIAAFLAIHALSTVQLQAGTVVWHWLYPDAAPPVHGVLEAIHRSEWGNQGVLQLAITAVIVAPIAEETFFRGLLWQCIWGVSGHAWMAIVTTGIVFGWVHRSQPQDVLPLATMGFILGYVRVHYRSLGVCMLIHALFNARSIVIAIWAPELMQQ